MATRPSDRWISSSVWLQAVPKRREHGLLSSAKFDCFPMNTPYLLDEVPRRTAWRQPRQIVLTGSQHSLIQPDNQNANSVNLLFKKNLVCL